MQQTPTPKRISTTSTQDFIPIESIHDGVVVLMGGQNLRAVLMVSALNFALKSEEEQDALVFQYENFLNSLDFPMQFIVQSRRLNIQPYLDTLGERQKQETNELLKVQITEYMEFVKSFVDLTHIVSKTFYAVVPFQPSAVAQTSGVIKNLSHLFGGTKPKPAEQEASFAEWKNQLIQRVDAVSLGLRRLDLRVVMLNTEELIELFYGLYNPTESQRVHDSEQKEESSSQSLAGQTP